MKNFIKAMIKVSSGEFQYISRKFPKFSVAYKKEGFFLLGHK